ncbi:hypothetical protein BPT24_139 [Tenacibaculum phage pT24]|uniref:Major capsid protein n=1 Tax=Tenacibaculum phage pT24 TaxID=1880590 RepID=A0A1B4XWT9_9CAUD|nr:hypothetical protein HYP10_gp139 [Tenacibaculum phage pT24]BAV39265.1 hypothetical protein BPT24_139 [Tenacibaculum phage pT24]
MVKYQKINPSVAKEKFGALITESTGVENQQKLETIAKICAITESIHANGSPLLQGQNILESYGATTPAQMPTMGSFVNPQNPNGTVGQSMDKAYQGGSDFTTARLGIAMNVAAQTIGLDLVPTIPIDMPLTTYGFLDIVYAGGRLDSAEHKISYISVSGGIIGTEGLDYSKLVKGNTLYITPSNGTALQDGLAIEGIYMGKSRIDASLILKVVNAGSYNATTNAFVADTTNSVLSVMNAVAEAGLAPTDEAGDVVAGDIQHLGSAFLAKHVSALDNHIQAASTVDQVTENPDPREVAEKGTTSRIGLRFYTKQVAPVEYAIEGESTRHQVTDLGAYGIDVYTELFKAAQNELSQSINKHITKTLFKLGVTTAASAAVSKGADLNLFTAPASVGTKAMNTFGFLASETGEFKDIMDVDRSGVFGAVKNSETNSSAENQLTRARKIQSKLLAAQALINNLSRKGEGDFAVVNSQVKAALVDSLTEVNSHASTISGNTAGLYRLGKIANLEVFCDPNMDWTDTRVLIGRKGNESDSGLKFMPYDLVSTVTTIPEGTMSIKFLVASRYALLPAGFHPELNYLTIALETGFGSWI